MEDEDLAVLVTRARDGDADAFGAIVRRFQDMAVGYAYSLLQNLQLAEDAAQEAFLEAYLCIPNLREPAAFPGWFRRIVFKQCDRLTRGKKEVVELDTMNEQSSRAPSQVAAMETTELKDQVWAAIDSLPEHERGAVVLFYIGGHSQQEVSEFLDVPVGTIKKRLFSARSRLREMLIDIVADTLRERRPSRSDNFAASVMEMLTAARTGDVGRVRELLRQNRRLLTARDWLGNTALIMAVNSGQNAVAELLFGAGVRPDIHEAAAIGQTERVTELLREDAARLDAYSEEGFTPLALAAHYGHQETTKYLLERNANPSIVSRHPLGVTPLHAALFGRQIETARLLIEHDSDVNARRGGKGWPRAGWTALHYTAGYGFVELIGPLLARGADLEARDDEGRTPLDVAVEEKQDQAAEMLRRVGAQQ
ncbi:MAG TPA: sigma-70 family RNA polymerase sigma factor [Blastocatellia bacterium]|nr:sigma-70 family RNA polymerase sigma factor [Blastocatellia bacterium]